MVEKVKGEQTPLSDVKFDAEGVAALLALLSNIANQGTAGSTAGALGNTNQLGAGSNASEVSMQAMADINVPEEMNGLVGLALNNATGHQARVQVLAEQLLSDSINASKQITQNAITQANNAVTDSVGHKHKRTTDQDTVAHFLDMQGVRNNDIGYDRLINIDEQIAAVEALYAALGRFLSSTKVEVPA